MLGLQFGSSKGWFRSSTPSRCGILPASCALTIYTSFPARPGISVSNKADSQQWQSSKDEFDIPAAAPIIGAVGHPRRQGSSQRPGVRDLRIRPDRLGHHDRLSIACTGAAGRDIFCCNDDMARHMAQRYEDIDTHDATQS